ncbi:DUF4294 domain-containing protein [Nonlabens antarcticus]|uniref:DUF4294 domain-containing protein n=1 Tax=Nonlabens antarcticus TaxID=392714 RepID=UPI001891978B|nr:DUF4294 domain-containing protein [Nonlabens antarcticus]
MIKRVFLGIMLIVVSAFAKAQTIPIPEPLKVDTVKTATPDYYYIDGDSVSSIELDEVLLIQDLKFTSRYERIRYLILQRKVKRVWPYAKLAAERLSELDERLSTIEKNRDKRRYAKMVEDYIEEEFTAELKKLTRTEGQILIKLIHRQTGDTAYELIRRLRSGWSAFWFNNTASIFDISLKEEYKPITIVEDFYVEDILQQQFKREELEPQKPLIPFDYFKGRNNWNTFQKNLPEDYDKINLAERAQKIEKYKIKKAKKDAREARRKRRRNN